jgi:hypothetical protein
MRKVGMKGWEEGWNERDRRRSKKEVAGGRVGWKDGR